MYTRHLDPELERLRNETLESSTNSESDILNIQRVATQIHTSCLFENEGKELLQKLCLFISATASGKSYGDWQKFAAHLGLTTEQIRCIDYDFKGLQDPTYYVLLTFSQKADANMDKMLLALRKINRLDVIHRISDNFNELFIEISKNHELKNGIYKPKSLPRAPLVLSLPVKHQTHDQSQPGNLCNSNDQNNTNKNGSQKYGSIVMLTFAEDGSKTAEEITKIFRMKNPRIGVIILQEQEKHVYRKAEEFIEDCINQVNYIVPILTEGYLNKINNLTCHEFDNNNLDSKYNRYIFSLMRYEYVQQDCINNRVRCIVPDNEVKKVLSMNLHPTLQAWFRESDVHLFAERILLRNF